MDRQAALTDVRYAMEQIGPLTRLGSDIVADRARRAFDALERIAAQLAPMSDELRATFIRIEAMASAAPEVRRAISFLLEEAEADDALAASYPHEDALREAVELRRAYWAHRRAGYRQPAGVGCEVPY